MVLDYCVRVTIHSAIALRDEDLRKELGAFYDELEKFNVKLIRFIQS
ncbi:hypothetical protein AB9M62_10045 [Bacillales bacterium AN1005]